MEATETLVSAALTPAIAKTKINLALTTQQLVIQTLQNKVDAVVANEDHLEEMKAVIAEIKRAKKIIDDKHEEIKKPYLDSSRACDTAKKELVSLYDAILNPFQKKYNDLCAEVERKKREEAAKEQRKRDTLGMIENICIDYSQKIAACKDRQELINVEKAINLEKGGQKAIKYGEFLDLAKDRFDAVLIPAIAAQKIIVANLERVASEIKQAEDAGDVEKLDELKDQHEQISDVFTHQKLKVQESAISAPSLSSTDEKVSVVHPTIPKGGRTDYDIEIVDLNTVFKKCPELLNITLKLAEAKAKAREFDEAEVFSQESSKVINGIKYTKKKVY